MLFKLVSNNYSKQTLPTLKLQFDTDFEQDKFVDHLQKLDFDGINWVAVRGVVDTVRYKPSAINYVGVTGIVDVVRIGQAESGGGGDPVSAIANGVGELGKIANQLIANRTAKKSREAEVRAMQAEVDLLSPMVEKIYGTFPFIATAYQERQRQAINKVHNTQKESNNQAWADLNTLLRNIVLSVTDYSAHKVQFLERTFYPVSYAQIDFGKEFADYFRKNPGALPPSTATNTTQNNKNSQATTTSTSSNILPILLLGGVIYFATQQPQKNKSSKKR